LVIQESHGIAQRWAGVRAVAYDGFPTIGFLDHRGTKIENARCTTHAESGGAFFGPEVTVMSRLTMNGPIDNFSRCILESGSSMRTAASA